MTASPSPSVAALLRELEALSRLHPARVLRLRGELPVDGAGDPDPAGARHEPFELLIFRGFSSSVTHPTAFDPDRPALPEGSRIDAAELLAGPLDPAAEVLLGGPAPPQRWLEAAAWDPPTAQLEAEV